MIELLRVMTPVTEQEGQDTELMGSHEVLWPNTEDLEKRDLPRLGVSIHIEPYHQESTAGNQTTTDLLFS